MQVCDSAHVVEPAAIVCLHVVVSAGRQVVLVSRGRGGGGGGGGGGGCLRTLACQWVQRDLLVAPCDKLSRNMETSEQPNTV